MQQSSLQPPVDQKKLLEQHIQQDVQEHFRQPLEQQQHQRAVAQFRQQQQHQAHITLWYWWYDVLWLSTSSSVT